VVRVTGRLSSVILKASGGDPDAYLTARTAMFKHGMVRSAPERLEIATRHASGFRWVDGFSCELYQLPPELLQGQVEQIDAEGYPHPIASPEKALFDFVYRQRRPVAPVGNGVWISGRGTGPRRLELRIAVPVGFRADRLDAWVALIREPEQRDWAARELKRLLAAVPLVGVAPRPGAPALRSGKASIDQLRADGRAVLSLTEAGALLGLVPSEARRVLRRLDQQGLVVYLGEDLCVVRPPLEPYLIAPLLVTGDAYISRRSALHFHGLLPKRPGAIEVVSAGPADDVRSARLGWISVSHADPHLWGGYEVWRSPGGSDVRMATPEKALLDLLLLGELSGLGSRREHWAAPLSIRPAMLRPWVNRIHSPGGREDLQKQLGRITDAVPDVRRSGRPESSPEASRFTLINSDMALPQQRDRGVLVSQARQILIEVASNARTIPFGAIIDQLSSCNGSELTAIQVNEILGRVARDELVASGHLLTSVVRLASTGMPCQSFFELGRELGWLDANGDEKAFAAEALSAAWGHWRT
jgi:hypothetical protein